MSPLPILIPAAIVGAAISGAIGMGGGVMLLAVMATVLEPAVVVPIHGVVQFTSNGTRVLALLRNVSWSIVAMYFPAMVLGTWIGLQLYRGADLPWFKPGIGLFVASFLLWDRFKPRRLQLPRWMFVPAGLGGGLLTITLGAAGPYLAAFFLRDDLERREIVATKAAIQTFGHLLKIPAFLSIGFRYQDHVWTMVPLLSGVILGTFVGTSLLHRMREDVFRLGFRAVLWILAVRLIASPWV